MDTEHRARVEIREAVHAMIENLKPIAERHPGTVTTASHFNSLLERARRSFPDSEAIRDIPRTGNDGVTFFDLLSMLSVLSGAVKADFAARNAAAMRQQNERTRAAGGFLRRDW
jgi:hypothetical protein